MMDERFSLQQVFGWLIADGPVSLHRPDFVHEPILQGGEAMARPSQLIQYAAVQCVASRAHALPSRLRMTCSRAEYTPWGNCGNCSHLASTSAFVIGPGQVASICTSRLPRPLRLPLTPELKPVNSTF